MDTFNNGMPKQYPIEYKCKAVECRVNVVNADALTLDEMRTLADREIRRQIAEKTRRSANKINGESVKFFNLSQREKQTSSEDVPTFEDLLKKVQPKLQKRLSGILKAASEHRHRSEVTDVVELAILQSLRTPGASRWLAAVPS